MSLRPQTTGSEQTTGPREEKCALLGHYAASSNSVQTFRDNLTGHILKGFFRILTLEDGTDVVPKRRQAITTTRCVINQKRAVLMYLTAEARYHASYWTSFI